VSAIFERRDFFYLRGKSVVDIVDLHVADFRVFFFVNFMLRGRAVAIFYNLDQSMSSSLGAFFLSFSIFIFISSYVRTINIDNLQYKYKHICF
jgi:hypothetical protein